MRAHTDQHTGPTAASSGRDTEQQLQSAGLQSPGSSVSPSNPVLSLSVPTEANRKIFTGAVPCILCAYLYHVMISVYISSCYACCKLYLLAVAEQMNLVMEHTFVIMPSQCTGRNCVLVNIAEQKAETTPIKVAIPTEVNRKAFPESPGGLISPGDNSTVYEPDR